ncbi:TetR family transcriptional regulator C-terminal domain-containing protein [Aureimonas sp. AU4]|uniref:TetR family transcriptional regulator C-terminal domain-containing protein n=1 Tax=Aureimonas sp. AU4 TaxID=1638163 RepID=UPI00078242F9|nr:TetR family transcriptional regulator C-terminal domain-containing protein [Aureimonas sp. AU4]
MDAKVTGEEERPATRIQRENREVILEAALKAFSGHGFRGTTIDEIARGAGMSKTNLLYYFRRKEDVYRAVLERTLDEWLAPLEALDPEGDPVEELRRYITLKLRMSRRTPEASRLFANEILSGAPVIREALETRLRGLVQKKAAVIRGWVGTGRLAPIDPVHLIFLIWATTQHYADFAPQIRAILGDQIDKPGFDDQAAQAVLTIVLSGIRPRPEAG